MGSSLGRLRLFLRSVLRSRRQSAQTGFEFRKDARVARASLHEANLVLPIWRFHDASHSLGIVPKQLVYEHSDYRFTVYFRRMGDACRLERSVSIEASPVEPSQSAATLGRSQSRGLIPNRNCFLKTTTWISTNSSETLARSRMLFSREYLVKNTFSPLSSMALFS